MRFPLRFSEVKTGDGEDFGIDLLADIDLINHDFFFPVQHITAGRMVEFDLLGEQGSVAAGGCDSNITA